VRRLSEALHEDGFIKHVHIDEIAAERETAQEFLEWVERRQQKLREAPLSKVLDNPDVFLMSLAVEGAAAALPREKFSFSRGDSPIKARLKELSLWRAQASSWTITAPSWERKWYEEYYPYTGNAPPVDTDDAYEKLLRSGDSDEAESYLRKHLETFVVTQDYVDYIPEDIALHYVSHCASKVATRHKRDLAADSTRFTDVVTLNPLLMRAQVSMSVLQAYVPDNLDSISPERLAEFRKEFSLQRRKYQKDIQAVTDEFLKVSSEDEFDRVKGTIVEIANERVRDVQQAYGRAKVAMVPKALGLSLTPPALATSIASLLGVGIFAPVGVAAAIALFGFTAAVEWNKAKSERDKSAWSYVLDVADI
jgi:hypothetical protein